MNRRGMTTGALIGLIVAIAVVLIFASPTFGFYERIGNAIDIFIPDSWKSEVKPVGGDVILGLNLKTNELQYYDGTNWRDMPKNKEVLEIGGKKLDIRETREAIQDFYGNTLRKTQKIFFYDETKRQFTIQNYPAISETSLGYYPKDYNFLFGCTGNSIKFGNKAGFYVYAIERLSHEFYNLPKYDPWCADIFIGEDNAVYSSDDGTLSKNLPFKDLDYSALIRDAVKWRDQIFEGEECEKFIEVNYEENNDKITGAYTVEKNYPYLVVRVDNSEIGNDKYSNCTQYQKVPNNLLGT